MKVPAIVPKVALEAVVVVGGAILAAAIIKQFPAVKAWIKEAWQ